jgi:serine/threonine protein kinase
MQEMSDEKYRNVEEALRAAVTLPDARALALTAPPALLVQHPQLRDVSFLGRGGMGAVFRAFDRDLDRLVAIKLVRPGPMGEEFTRRLRREAEALTSLRHPNIVELLRVEEREGQLLLVMAHVDGVPLRRFARDTRVDLGKLLTVMLLAGEALCAAHASGLMHRDVKPDNILVRNDGTPCLLDFGLARAALPHGALGTLTRPGDVVGTPAYMAPEQARGERGNAQSDQYAWAVTTFEACTGCHPRVARPGRDPLAATRSLPAPVADVLERAMAEQPDQRFATLADALAALRAQL